MYELGIFTLGMFVGIVIFVVGIMFKEDWFK
jgi:hypothetical protein